MSDPEQMAALVVSDDGEIRCVPEWEEDGLEFGWYPVRVDEGVAAGILRLLRER